VVSAKVALSRDGVGFRLGATVVATDYVDRNRCGSSLGRSVTVRALIAISLLSIAGCAAEPPRRPSSPPAFDYARADRCVRAYIEQRFTDLGEAIMEEAVERCDFPTGYDRTIGLQRAAFTASSVRVAAERPFRDRRNTETARANIERAERRRSEVDAASRIYLNCVIDAIREIALVSDEAAPVIVDAARGSCPNEVAALQRADWRMRSELDGQARPALIARVLQVRRESLR
jgi:hypothetical protein